MHKTILSFLLLSATLLFSGYGELSAHASQPETASRTLTEFSVVATTTHANIFSSFPANTNGKEFDFEAVEIEEDEKHSFKKNLSSVQLLVTTIFNTTDQFSFSSWSKSCFHTQALNATYCKMYVLFQVFRL